jgi:hypothetical protein
MYQKGGFSIQGDTAVLTCTPDQYNTVGKRTQQLQITPPAAHSIHSQIGHADTIKPYVKGAGK